jgi:hypothetical protein
MASDLRHLGGQHAPPIGVACSGIDSLSPATLRSLAACSPELRAALLHTFKLLAPRSDASTGYVEASAAIAAAQVRSGGVCPGGTGVANWRD